MGPTGVVAYMFIYIVLELLAVPAIPLTMTAGTKKFPNNYLIVKKLKTSVFIRNH